MISPFIARVGILAGIVFACIACTDPSPPDVDMDVQGIVRDSLTRAGIPDAKVTLYRAVGFTNATPLATRLTDTAGRYVLKVHVERCFNSLTALGVEAANYRTALVGYGFDPPDRSPQCNSSPQTVNVTLQR